jgi:biopolymer transport protein ExbB/TolQ
VEEHSFSIAKSFAEGGFFMWPVLVCSIFVWGLAIERAIYLYFRASAPTEKFLAVLEKAIVSGDLSRAVKVASMSSFPLARVVHAGLLKVTKSEGEVQAAMDEAALREIPKIEKRTPYLAMLGNVAMLTGLLGTIGGMITSFAAVANADPATKAAKLAAGISEAMNCTAFGLITAIPALLLYALLQGKTQSIVDTINEGSVRVINFVMSNRDRLAKSEAA